VHSQLLRHKAPVPGRFESLTTDIRAYILV
jgi:hypothetical protein